jgi:hypothetical protein
MKKLTLIAAILFSIGAFAQEMKVHKTDGNVETFMLSQIDSITFTTSIINDGLVAYYPFNGNANDESENDRDLSNFGASLSSDRFGNSNSAYFFNGTSSYLQANNYPSLLTEFSYSAWISITDPGTIDKNNNFGCYGIESPGVSVWDFAYNKNTSLLWIFDRTNSEFSTNLNLDLQWVHIIVIYNNTTRNLYINGNLINTENIYTPISSLPSYNFRIGTHINGAQKFQGAIDDIRIYNRALNESEIDALYHEGGW